jgi:prophage maintenance system killer protein
MKTVHFAEISFEEIVRLNHLFVEAYNRWHPEAKIRHEVENSVALHHCLQEIFHKDTERNYLNAPLEKMAGIILYRLSKRHFFLDGSRPTAFLATLVFLNTNGHGLNGKHLAASELIWGIAPGEGNKDQLPLYGEAEAIRYISDNIVVLPSPTI